ncbi:MAG: septation protein IspZ, partial [Pseudomonadota bacterium]
FFAVLALANELVWRTLSTDLWVKIETFGFPIALMAFLMFQFSVLQTYMDDPDRQ